MVTSGKDILDEDEPVCQALPGRRRASFAGRLRTYRRSSPLEAPSAFAGDALAGGPKPPPGGFLGGKKNPRLSELTSTKPSKRPDNGIRVHRPSITSAMSLAFLPTVLAGW